VLSQNTVFFTAPRFLDLPKETLRPRVKRLAPQRYAVTLRARTFQHQVALDLDGLSFRASDNYFDLYPSEPRAITVELEKPCDLATVRKRLSVMSLADTY
jgi:beta-mannosidase